MKKTETKVEMKKNVLPGNPLELNDAALESVAGGTDGGMESTGEEGGVPDSVRDRVVADLISHHGPGGLTKPEPIEVDPEQYKEMMEKHKDLEKIARRQIP